MARSDRGRSRSRRFTPGLLLAGLALAGCDNPALELTVRPAVAAPGEPLFVAVAVNGPPPRRVPLQVLDAHGALLAAADAELVQGRAGLWLYPVAPGCDGDIVVKARGPGRRGRSRWRRLRVGIDPGRNLVDSLYLDGFHPRENGGDGEYRWTTGCASGQLAAGDGDAVVHLRFSCGREVPRQAWLELGAAPPVPLACGEERPSTLRIHVRHAAWDGSAFLPYRIRVEPAFSPAELGAGGDDERELGLRLFFLYLGPFEGHREEDLQAVQTLG